MIHLLEARVCLEEPFSVGCASESGALARTVADILVENRE
jgi:hypothetical protein